MLKVLVTVKLPRNPEHDPLKKKTGLCPVDSMKFCTDVTGQHHTVYVEYPDNLAICDIEAVWSMTHHVTRVEEV